MVSRKSIRWALALLILAAAVTAIVMWRIAHNEQKAAAILARKSSKSSSKIKAPPPEEPPDEPKAPPPPKAPKATVLGPAAKEHLAEKAFITALRAALQWRSTQPRTPETSRAFLEKLSAIAVDDLPAERKTAWLSLLEAWREIEQHPATVPDPKLQEQGRKAAEMLNLMLKDHGDMDLLF